MATFRKKPVEVDAILFTGENYAEIGEFLGQDWSHVMADPDSHALIVTTLEGRMRCPMGDWLIRGTEGELYPCADAVFQTVYEPVR